MNGVISMKNDDKNLRKLIKSISLDSPSLEFNELLMRKIQLNNKAEYTPLLNKKVFHIIFVIFAIFVLIATFAENTNNNSYNNSYNYVRTFIFNNIPSIVIPEWLVLSTLVIFILFLGDMMLRKYMESKMR